MTKVGQDNRPWWQRQGPLEWLRLARLLRERIAQAERDQPPGILHDPIEDDPELQGIVASARAQAEREEPVAGLGSCFRIWAAQKRILRREHGIDWFSHADMNPRVLFD